MAPDWVSPTEGNGSDLPRADLHIALVAPSNKAADLAALRNNIRVVRPPLWKGGKVYLHIIPPNKNGVDIRVAQALVDLGLLDSKDLDIAPPDGVDIGYPSGLSGDMR